MCKIAILTRCATKNDRIRVLDDSLIMPISESLVNQDQKTSCTWGYSYIDSATPNFLMMIGIKFQAMDICV